jgi:hypothetical protein
MFHGTVTRPVFATTVTVVTPPTLTTRVGVPVGTPEVVKLIVVEDPIVTPEGRETVWAIPVP